jgi:iron complex transport system ATP-binding protein
MRDPPLLLQVTDLTVRREIPILQSIHWRVRRGEHWVILGPNGSGKTSLLSALTAYLTPSAGRIEILGETYGQTDWRELRKRIGLVSSSVQQMVRDDETALHAVLSGKEAMINFWGQASPADQKKALRILKEVECAPLKDRPWAYLSQGERQRVLIGRALMADYRLLILDEPCAGLDLVARERFLRFLGNVAGKKEGPALVLVTHHVEEILPTFSHLLLLKKGKVLASGKKDSVLTSRRLTEAFETPLRLKKSGGRYTAVLTGRSFNSANSASLLRGRSKSGLAV